MSAILEVLSAADAAKTRSEIREIVTGLRRSRFSQFRVCMLKAFIDDSGSAGDSPWFVLAGYIGTVEEEWDRFDPPLGIRPAVSPIHPSITSRVQKPFISGVSSPGSALRNAMRNLMR